MVLHMKGTSVLCLPEASMAELYENFFSEKNRARIIDCIRPDMVQSRCALPVTEGDEVKTQIGTITVVCCKLLGAHIGRRTLTESGWS